MKEKCQGITKGTGSILALITCIVYTIMTILFIVRHSLDLKLFLLSVAIMIAMVIITVSMWIGFIVSKIGKISSVSTILAKVGLIIKMIAGAILVTANFIAFFVLRSKIVSKLSKDETIKKLWDVAREEIKEESDRYGFKFSVPSYNQFLVILIIIAIILLAGLAMYILLGILSCNYVGKVKKNSKYGGIVTGNGIKISLIGFTVCNIGMLVFKIIQYAKIHGIYSKVMGMANSLTMGLTGDAADKVSYNSILKYTEQSLKEVLKDSKAPIHSINLRYGIGLSTGALIMDIIYVVLMVAFTVLVFILIGNIKKNSLMTIGQSEDIKEDDFFNPKDDNEGTTQLLSQESYGIGTDNRYKLRKGSIECISGTDVGFVYALEEGEEFIIGKDPKAAHIIVGNEYKQVSRRHCGIRYDVTTDSYNVIDYSSNGTYVNGTRRLTNGIYMNVSKGNDIYLATDKNVYRLG